MKKNAVPNKWFIGLFACLLVSCSENKNQFVFEGTIQNAPGKTLYIENIGTTALTLVDSIKIANDGSFRFKHKRPDFPDFYRLRLGNRFINLCVDSTETIRVTGNAEHFATEYTVEGSSECLKIKELTKLQINADKEYNHLKKQFEAKKISVDEYVAQTNQVIDNYKTEARKYIYANPVSPSAYFALFQQINELLIFDPYDKTDLKAFGAVANTWNQFHPGTPRAVHLYNMFTNSLAVLRGERPIKIIEGNEKEMFDIELPSLNDKNIKLSDIGEGKLTLIDFTAYGMKESPAHSIALAEAYTKYKSKGFEIYQVSVDADNHFWKNAASNLPWICVRDPQSIYSEILKRYNISEIPVSFLRDKEGMIVARIESDKELDKEITLYLK